MKVGVDIGGTFTDVLVATGDGSLDVIKTPSHPDAPEQGVVDGLSKIPDTGDRSLSALESLSHGTTVATNAVLEGNWAETALVTTAGFRDVLEIGRQDRPDLYDLQAEKPTPVVPRRRRYEVPGRLTQNGTVIEEFDTAQAREVARTIANSGVSAVAVCFLNAFEDPRHERRMRDLLEAECDGVSVTLSSDILPEIREYERTTTTAMSASLEPVMDRYLDQLNTALDNMGVPASLNVMQSNGGIITANTAREKAINTLLSGPAAGVEGAAYVGRSVGFENIITMDMGGTSCDVSIVPDGAPVRSAELEVGRYPIRIPMVDVHTIGNGGGSIARIDSGGALRVGPLSAGAQPGPICYGRGGEEVTITDAHAMLGRVDPTAFLGDGLGVGDDALTDAFESGLCDSLGRTPEQVAQDVIDVTNANMQRALKVISTERGHDPREFTLVAFGGAGPLHATALARDLNIGQVLIPRHAGVLSALGLLVSDTVYDYVKTHLERWNDIDAKGVESGFQELTAEGGEQLKAADIPPEDRHFDRSIDVRYVGQSFELTVSIDQPVTEGELAAAAERFHNAHRQRYGHANPEEPLELVNLRLDAIGEASPPSLSTIEPPDHSASAAVRTHRPVSFDGETFNCPVHDRSQLPADGSFHGPAIIEGDESTITVHPSQAASIDKYGNVVVETQEGSK